MRVVSGKWFVDTNGAQGSENKVLFPLFMETDNEK